MYDYAFQFVSPYEEKNVNHDYETLDNELFVADTTESVNINPDEFSLVLAR